MNSTTKCPFKKWLDRDVYFWVTQSGDKYRGCQNRREEALHPIISVCHHQWTCVSVDCCTIWVYLCVRETWWCINILYYVHVLWDDSDLLLGVWIQPCWSRVRTGMNRDTFRPTTPYYWESCSEGVCSFLNQPHEKQLPYALTGVEPLTWCLQYLSHPSLTVTETQIQAQFHLPVGGRDGVFCNCNDLCYLGSGFLNDLRYGSPFAMAECALFKSYVYWKEKYVFFNVTSVQDLQVLL